MTRQTHLIAQYYCTQEDDKWYACCTTFPITGMGNSRSEAIIDLQKMLDYYFDILVKRNELYTMQEVNAP